MALSLLSLSLLAIFYSAASAVPAADTIDAAPDSAKAEAAALGFELCTSSATAEYDYIVVGSGSGGGPLAARLAQADYKVLVIETGENVENVNNTIPAYFARATDDPKLTINYTINEYPAGFKYQKTNWYPRGKGLGGTTNMNAMINIIAGTTPDFDPVASWSKDPSWTRANMQKYYDKMINEWLKISGLPLDVLALHPEYLDAQLNDAFINLGAATDPTVDINAAGSDAYEGGALPSFTIDSHHVRSGIRYRLLEIQRQKSNLSFSLNTLATKVNLCWDWRTGRQRAYGVTIAKGAQLPGTAGFQGKQSLKTTVVRAKREVIVSAGTYQSPQLLMLSGIGDPIQLALNGILPLVNLPGVGKNLQDHDEITVIWHLKKDYEIFKGCKFLSDPNKDACLKQWQVDHANLYSFGSAVNALTYTSPNRGLKEPDMFTFFGLVHSHGIIPGYPQMIADNPNALTAVILKAHSSTKGTVSLTGGHIQDTIKIFKNRFQDPKLGYSDVQDLREGIKKARSIVNAMPLAQHIEREVAPGIQAQTDAQIEDHVYKQIFAHHACCTNAMGPESNKQAVIDNDFRVHGVDGLRVVDMSSWSVVPGYFVATATYMISEKAADAIIAAAKAA